jgi:hypothetical protein
MRSVLIFIPFLLLATIVVNQDERTRNFPRLIQYVDSMPLPENTWVFILAGQSNMAGRGTVEPQDTIPDKGILSLTPDNRWVIAKEPLQLYQPSVSGLGPGLAFAREIADKTDHKMSIALIPCAVGGSSVDNWLNDSLFNGVRLKSNFIEKIMIAKKVGVIKGIVWHQGEADATPERSKLYMEKLLSLIRFFREEAGIDTLPVIIGELGLFPGNEYRINEYSNINRILSDIALKEPNIYLVTSNGLNPNLDNVHFDGPSQRTMGKRYADAYLKFINHQ